MKRCTCMKKKYWVDAEIPFSEQTDFLTPLDRHFAKEYFNSKKEAKDFIKKMKYKTWKLGGGEIYGFDLKFRMGVRS